MDPQTFVDSDWNGSGGMESDQQFSESEGSSSGDGFVRAQVRTADTLTPKWFEQVAAVDTVDRLIGRLERGSRNHRTRGDTSLFSERTRRRWALGEDFTNTAVATGGGPKGGPAGTPPVGDRRRSLCQARRGIAHVHGAGGLAGSEGHGLGSPVLGGGSPGQGLTASC
jgi:hypothetical protein